MSEDLDINNDLLLKFFRNECSPDEYQQVITWIQNKGNENVLKEWMFEHWRFFAEQSQSNQPDIEKIWTNLQNDLFITTDSGLTIANSDNNKYKIKKVVTALSIAASFILILSFGWYFIKNSPKIAESSLPTISKDIVRINVTSAPEDIELEDGSIVTLMPSSKISIPQHFSSNRREVLLEGEAFFHVTKDSAKPFYVFCKGIVTHVTGTSFNVKEDKKFNNVEVAVHSGSVEVYKVSDQNAEKEDVTILTPNHKAIYSANSEEKPTTRLIEKPVLVNSNYIHQNQVDNFYDSTAYFDFRYSTMLSVINALENAYSISIEVNNKKIYNCHFSGDLSKKELYQKLDIINKALNTTYEINGTAVIIRGEGCDE